VGREWLTESEDDTMAVGRAVGAELPPGAVVHLNGDLGAGKTVFVRGLAEGLGMDRDDVSSPTFTLIQEYQGRDGRKLFHVDLYRLAGSEVGDLGLDALAAEGIVAIEWANRLPDPDHRAVIVTIEEVEERTRRIRIDGLPEDG
jgi:tRNA threonylcarbamoyladenosine biosynthesis protein TsaE